ncbi:hypothetical protein GCM10022224_093570 [Nonomuraea antimicrobica]|uniref:Uncharacterized protein n=1 Tax=Nonomuraea antimicrobica TaxID=561173 RepID=A0ABP7E2D0_9ACTN
MLAPVARAWYECWPRPAAALYKPSTGAGEDLVQAALACVQEKRSRISAQLIAAWAAGATELLTTEVRPLAREVGASACQRAPIPTKTQPWSCSMNIRSGSPNSWLITFSRTAAVGARLGDGVPRARLGSEQ